MHGARPAGIPTQEQSHFQMSSFHLKNSLLSKEGCVAGIPTEM